MPERYMYCCGTATQPILAGRFYGRLKILKVWDQAGVNNFPSAYRGVDWSHSSNVESDPCTSRSILAHSMNARKYTIEIIVNVNQNATGELAYVSPNTSHNRSRKINFECRITVIRFFYLLYSIK